ncbi:DUF1499 domain-containing protein [Almyronema epifaneia]|uniref:DUF1499 domain-containing protein n=1 Tax=Almyronema epifaneia S1 TaxID=2991925 RepID=A0ABW6I9R2_9CYAN
MPLFSFSGKRPTNLGTTEGQLAACPDTPNCVSSQATDKAHSIAPIRYEGSASEAIAQLKSIVQSMDRTQIVTEKSDYLHAEFTSQLMGFVDDVEFFVPGGENIIHVRSAARLGKSDLGINRKRIEEIRDRFQA